MPSRPIMNPLSKRTLIVCSAYVLTKTPRILRINLQMQDGASASEFFGPTLDLKLSIWGEFLEGGR